MAQETVKTTNIPDPILTRTAYGAWMACSPPGERIRTAVVQPDQEAAVGAFRESWQAWAVLMERLQAERRAKLGS